MEASAPTYSTSLVTTLRSGIQRTLSWMARAGKRLLEWLFVAAIVVALLIGNAIYYTWRALVWTYRAVGQSNRAMILISSVGLVSFWGMVTLESDYSLYAAKTCAGILLATLFYFIVRVVHAKLDPLQQIKERNIAFVAHMALYLVALVIGFMVIG